MTDVNVCDKHDLVLSKTAVGYICTECAREDLAVRIELVKKAEYEEKQPDELEQRRKHKANKLDLVGIPPRFRGRKLGDYHAATTEQKKVVQAASVYTKRLLGGEQVGGVVMYGNVGTGKTHIACAIASAFEASGKRVLFTSVADMISKIREAYDSNNYLTELEAIKQFRDLDLLVLDEVGVQKGDDKEVNLLTRVIDQRYGWLKPTILLSNLSPNEMERLLGQRIIDRLKEDGGLLLNFSWQSFRAQAADYYKGVSNG